MTNQTQHTAGPWEAHTATPDTKMSQVPPSARESMIPWPTPPAFVTAGPTHWPGNRVVAAVFHADGSHADANARLIAAAPELLEALVKLSPMFNNDNKLLTVYAAEVEACRAAIAKAGVEIL